MRTEVVTLAAARSAPQVGNVYGFARSSNHPETTVPNSSPVLADVEYADGRRETVSVRPGAWFGGCVLMSRVWLYGSAGVLALDTGSDPGESVLPSSAVALSLEERVPMPAGLCTNAVEPNSVAPPYFIDGFLAGTLLRVLHVPTWARRGTLVWLRPAEAGNGALVNPGLRVYELDAADNLYVPHGGAVAAVTGGQSLEGRWPLVTYERALPAGFLLSYVANRVISGDEILCRWSE